MLSFKNIYFQLKKYWKTPEMFVLVIMLGATAATFLSTVFYIPLVLKITAVLVFIGISFVMLNNQTKLAYWKSEGETKNNELNAMINGAQDGIVIYDANFQITSFNKAAETIFNINTNEILGKFLTPEMAKDPKIKIFAQIMFPSLAPQAIQISKGAWPQIVDFIFDSPQLRLRTVLSEIKNKTIVLTGAMVPYKFGSSDGLFNLGSALAFVQLLPHGIYIVMNGHYFNWDNVRKIKKHANLKK